MGLSKHHNSGTPPRGPRFKFKTELEERRKEAERKAPPPMETIKDAIARAKRGKR